MSVGWVEKEAPKAGLFEAVLEPVALCPGGRRRLERLMGICKSGRLQPEKLITQEFRGFDAIEDAFDLMASKSRELVKPIIYV